MIFESAEKEPFECFLNRVGEYDTEYEVVVDGWDVADDGPYAEGVTCLVEGEGFGRGVVGGGEVGCGVIIIESYLPRRLVSCFRAVSWLRWREWCRRGWRRTCRATTSGRLLVTVWWRVSQPWVGSSGRSWRVWWSTWVSWWWVPDLFGGGGLYLLALLYAVSKTNDHCE